MLEMIVEQSSKVDSYVLDCFAGSGSTLLAAAKLGRKWVGIDQSDYASEVVKNRFKEHGYQFMQYETD
jgi:adenine-specific DNA-methyltransferase